MSNFKGTTEAIKVWLHVNVDKIEIASERDPKKVIAKLEWNRGLLRDEYICNAKLFQEALEVRNSIDITLTDLLEERNQLLDVLAGLVVDVRNLLGDHDIEWQQAGHYNEAKELIKSITYQTSKSKN